MPRHLPLAALIVLAVAAPALAQTPSDTDVKRHIDALSNFTYATRMTAARMIRRAPADLVVPALEASARSHPDEFVRYRALIILTSFNDGETADLMRELMTDRNDRVREVVYRWFERNPSTDLADALIRALSTEQSEFVRPALIRAVAALPRSDRVERALLAEIGRGFDFFRSAVITALGDHRATYALEAIADVTKLEGTLQDDAVIALGRIGDKRGLTALAPLEKTAPDVAAAVQAAQCLLGDTCDVRLAWLRDTARNPATPLADVRASVNALAVIAEINADGREMLVRLAVDANDRLRRETSLAFSALALRRPADVVAWLTAASEADRMLASELLREGFESLEEDFAEEQFFGAARAAYWKAPDGAPARTITAALIDRLEF